MLFANSELSAISYQGSASALNSEESRLHGGCLMTQIRIFSMGPIKRRSKEIPSVKANFCY